MAELTRLFPPGDYPVVVIGSGPGAIQIAYSLGRTCFGNLPGVLAKSKGFSACNAVTMAKT